MNTEEMTEALDYEGYRKRKPKKTKKKRGKLFLALMIGAMSVVAVMMSPVFTIKEVIVSDTLSQFTAQEICDITGVQKGANIFTINKNKGIATLKKSFYIEAVEIVQELPSTVSIYVTERKVRGYIPYMGSYLYIDEYGRVLDVKEFFIEPLPLIKGLEFEQFQLGEKIDALNKDSLDALVVISQVMTKYELLDLAVYLDISDTSHITAKVNNVEVTLGTISNCDEKIRTMAAIIKEIPKEDRGTLDLSDSSVPYVFKYLT